MVMPSFSSFVLPVAKIDLTSEEHAKAVEQSLNGIMYEGRELIVKRTWHWSIVDWIVDGTGWDYTQIPFQRSITLFFLPSTLTSHSSTWKLVLYALHSVRFNSTAFPDDSWLTILSSPLDFATFSHLTIIPSLLSLPTHPPQSASFFLFFWFCKCLSCRSLVSVSNTEFPLSRELVHIKCDNRQEVWLFYTTSMSRTYSKE